MKGHVSSGQELLKQRLLDQADKKLLKNNTVTPLLYVQFTFYLLIFGDGDGMHAYGGIKKPPCLLRTIPTERTKESETSVLITLSHPTKGQ